MCEINKIITNNFCEELLSLINNDTNKEDIINMISSNIYINESSINVNNLHESNKVSSKINEYSEKCEIINNRGGDIYNIKPFDNTKCICRIRTKDGFPIQCWRDKFIDDDGSEYVYCKLHKKKIDTKGPWGEGHYNESMPQQHVKGSTKEGKNHCWKCDENGIILNKRTPGPKKNISGKKRCCSNCGQLGHFKKTCPLLKNEKVTKSSKPNVTFIEKKTIINPDESSKSIESTNSDNSTDTNEVSDNTKVSDDTNEDTDDTKVSEDITKVNEGIEESSVDDVKSINNKSELEEDTENYGIMIDNIKYTFDYDEDEKRIINQEDELVGYWNSDDNCINWLESQYEEDHLNHKNYIKDI